ncbi:MULTISPECIES: ABC transporter permease [unclassified Streptomyces]|uniref:ABC transporter permease n=1 Tax=unclassified Streptomyces TaxID=2593676 RepID=UPI00081B7C65|nr:MULTISPECIES: ABC transporter permease [unclassified Streptomyces]MYQ87567.1 ABC transporter permease [Streptomyces sp. SID4936]SCE48392.1 ABC-2 type transport system permease protein [Streptomyces sp. DvalAA-43]
MTAVTTTAPSGTRRRTPVATGQLAGTWPLLRLALRRDRIMLPIWVLALGGTFSSVGSSIAALYDTSAQRAELAASMNGNSSLRAMYGPVFDDSVGGLVSWRMAAFGAVLAAVMSLIVVIRHTREEEETGRQEMLSSAMVGRRAPLTAALLTAVIANAALALVIAAGLAGSGAGGAGAVALALAVAGTGVLFACTAAIAAQFTESARLAKGLTAAVIGAAFVLKAAGDSAADDGSSVMTWLSPIGWAENVRAYADERWWVLLVLAAAVAVQAVLAYTLAGRRDVGMSFLATRPGPAQGRITTAFGLSLRLQRGALTGWTLSFAVVGVAFGGLTGGAADLVGDNEKTREIFERMGGQAGLTDAFLATMVSVLGMVAALYIVASVLRLHGEETAGRAEPVLAGGVGRIGWAAGHLVVAFGGAALLMAAGGLGLAVGYGHELPAVLGASLVQLPAIWLLGGVTVLLYGAFPKAAVAAWGIAGICLALGWLGPAVDMPQAVMDVSPFTHLPKLPGGTGMEWGPVLILTAVAAVVVGAGVGALRRRDVLT